MAENLFSRLPDDIILNIFFRLEEDPRHWSRLACVCDKFSSLIRTVCWRAKCSQTLPSSLVSDLLWSSSPSACAELCSLHKLSVCCPGLLQAGVLLENSDFGLHRVLGPDDSLPTSDHPSDDAASSSKSLDGSMDVVDSSSDCCWSLYDDLYYDTVYNKCDDSASTDDVSAGGGGNVGIAEGVGDPGIVRVGKDASLCKGRMISRAMRSHMASGTRNLCREQGNKLLASRFRGDCLYISDWPGCVHIGDKRNYMLFRGVFKNFKRSVVWRTINDGNRSSKIDLNCAFCSCKETWDLHSAFCLRRFYGYHDDGEPVVRAYVCENGHVSGAWTNLPMYA